MPFELPGAGAYPTSGVVGLELDPVSEDAGNEPLVLVDAANAWLISEELPAPEEDSLWTSSRDMDGDLLAHTRHRNRKCTWTIRVHGWGATAADKATNLQGFVHTVERKVDKIRREGGHVKRTLPSGDSFVLPLLAGSTGVAFDKRWQANHRVTLTLEFTGSPYWLGAWQTVPLTETTIPDDPVLVTIADPVPGSVSALGRLRLESQETYNLGWAAWGMESSFSPSAKLNFDFTSMTPLYGATNLGSGVGIRSSPLTVAWQAFVSVACPNHKGKYRVFVDAYANNDAEYCLIAAEFANGDFRQWTRNAAVSPGPGPSRKLLDLGVVDLDEGSEVRIVARKTLSGMQAYVQYVFLIPVGSGYGEASGVDRQPSPTTVVASDLFGHAAGALTGKSLTVGGVWSGAGDTDGVTTTGSSASRAAVSDSAPRWETASTTNAAGVTVSARLQMATNVSGTHDVRSGVVARYTDTSNHVRAYLSRSGLGVKVAEQLVVEMVSSGGVTTIGSAYVQGVNNQFIGSTVVGPLFVGPWLMLTLTILDSGNWYCSLGPESGQQAVELSGFSTYFASGAQLPTGRVGLFDYAPTSPSRSTVFTEFSASGVAPDPAIFAGQAIEIRNDGVLREYASGSSLTPVSIYTGDYLYVPCGTSLAERARFFAVACRNAPGSVLSGDADLVGTLQVRPRYIHLPDPDA